MFLGRQFFWGEEPQISESILQITVTTEHVAKFGDDRPRDQRLGDEKKKVSMMIETYQQ